MKYTTNREECEHPGRRARLLTPENYFIRIMVCDECGTCFDSQGKVIETRIVPETYGVRSA